MTFQSGGNGFPWGFGLKRWRVAAPPPLLDSRILDGIPGFVAWLSLMLVVIGAVYVPWTVFSIAAIIATYMAARIALAGFANWMGFRRIGRYEMTDWRAEYERRRRPESLAWEEVRHLVILPSYQEDCAILRATLERLAASPLARDQVIVVLAMEQSDPQAYDTAAALQEEFAGRFCYILATFHPRGLPGEIQAKSANIAWASRHARRELVERLGLPLENIVITAGDADSLLHPKYLECLTCLFATSERRYAEFWQAPIRYHNNVWNSNPALAYLHAYSSAWEMAYLSGSWWQALPISTYSLSMKLADDVGYWDPDVIADECHMFIKCYFARAGNLRLTPLYLPFSGYAVAGDNFLDACRNRYRQTVRHAWGAKEIGYTIRQMSERPIPLVKASRVLLRVIHDNLMAGAGWVIITFGTQLPLVFKPELVVDGLWTPQFILLQASTLVIILMSLWFWGFDMRLRPPRATAWRPAEVLLTGISFVALPFIVLFLLAMPVLEAQTRLMLGIPLEFKVSRKV